MAETLKIIMFLLRMARGIARVRLLAWGALVAGILGGAIYSLLIAILSTALSEEPSRTLSYSFLTLCVLAPVTRFTSQVLLDSIGTRAVFGLRLDLCRQILSARLGRVEELGEHRLLASLSEDMSVLTTAFGQLPMLCMEVGVILSALVYMAWLSPPLLVLVLGGLLLGTASFRLPTLRSGKFREQARSATDSLFAHFRDLIYGSKELKLHRERRAAFVASDLIPTGRAMERSMFLGSFVFTTSNTWGNFVFFAVLGVILFGFGREMAGTPRVLAGYTLALLYMRTPLEVIRLSLPMLRQAGTAAAALQRVEGQLTADTGEPEGRNEPGPEWKSLELRGVSHTYSREGEAGGFSLGPIRLSFVAGEIIFLIGGNGSGKTTLAKILTGLYAPESGEIVLDGDRVTDENRDDYRQRFSAVFGDFHLFDTVIGPEGDYSEREAARLLAHVQLEGRVRIEGGRFSTVDLSQGQRKRLALVAACLECRPILFFDEWAADQDPKYKRVFYLELLPELKARGRTVIVISHDDAYFSVADRLIKLTEGQVEWDRRREVADRLPA